MSHEMREGDIATRVHARKENYGDNVELLICRVNWQGRITHTCEPLVMKEREGPFYIHPTAILQPQQAQQLMDELWQCGFRPSEGTGSAGALAATQKHLDDMRRLVFAGMDQPIKLEFGGTSPIKV